MLVNNWEKLENNLEMLGNIWEKRESMKVMLESKLVK